MTTGSAATANAPPSGGSGSRDRPQPSSREAALMEAVESLPARLREPVLLHYWADLPIDAVATTLGRPVGTVKRQLHEARGW